MANDSLSAPAAPVTLPATGAGASEAGPTTGQGATATAGGHLWQVDVLRLLTFLAVISVHSLAFTEVPGNEVAAGVMMLLQFGREVFFAISGFVLVHASRSRPVRPARFWRRRLPAVVTPYLAWSAIYYGAGFVDSGAHLSWATIWRDLLGGGASYHLYFLVVTMQLYVVFPFLLPLVRRTAAHAWWVLGAVGVLNLTWLGMVEYVPRPAGTPGWFWVHAYQLLPSYAVYVLAGCYAAAHLERVTAYVRDHARRLLAVSAASAAVALAVYAHQLGWMAPRTANAVLQPAMAASCLAATLTLYLVGTRWAAGRRRWASAVTVGSEVSFGVYLAHPLVLTVLLRHGLSPAHQVVPAALATVLGVLGAASGAVVICLVARRTPLALPLTGRPRVRARPGVLSARGGGSGPGPRGRAPAPAL